MRVARPILAAPAQVPTQALTQALTLALTLALAPTQVLAMAGGAQPPLTLTTTCPTLPAPPTAPAPVPPVSGFPQILQPGHWSWTGHDYSWTPPVWLTLLARGRPVWQPEHWTLTGNACVWHEAKYTYVPKPKRK
jgi:hypothetical protein